MSRLHRQLMRVLIADTVVVGCGDLALALGRPDLIVSSVDVRLYARAVDGTAQALVAALEEAHAAA